MNISTFILIVWSLWIVDNLHINVWQKQRSGAKAGSGWNMFILLYLLLLLFCKVYCSHPALCYFFIALSFLKLNDHINNMEGCVYVYLLHCTVHVKLNFILFFSKEALSKLCIKEYSNLFFFVKHCYDPIWGLDPWPLWRRTKADLTPSNEDAFLCGPTSIFYENPDMGRRPFNHRPCG